MIKIYDDETPYELNDDWKAKSGFWERYCDSFQERKLPARWVNRPFDKEYWIETVWVATFLIIFLVALRYVVWVIWSLT